MFILLRFSPLQIQRIAMQAKISFRHAPLWLSAHFSTLFPAFFSAALPQYGAVLQRGEQLIAARPPLRISTIDTAGVSGMETSSGWRQEWETQGWVQGFSQGYKPTKRTLRNEKWALRLSQGWAEITSKAVYQARVTQQPRMTTWAWTWQPLLGHSFYPQLINLQHLW